MIPDLEAFAGDWRVERTIDDRYAGRQGHFEGAAQFIRDTLGLAYAEIGLLTLGDAPPLKAGRRYFWRAEPHGIGVFFEDGRPFHSIANAPAPEAIHHCDPDTYRVTYDFARWPRWRATWRVAGPAKDYDMVTEYARP